MANVETKQIDSIISSRRAMLAVGGAALAGLALTSKADAQTATISDNDILNFALNLEYLEAQFYSLAVYGTTIDASLGISLAPHAATLGAAGTVTTKTPFTKVPFQNTGVAAYAKETAIEEGNHVKYLQQVLGNLAVSMPNIDLVNSFNALGQLAIQSNFDPFAANGNITADAAFLLGAYIFEDTGVSAYHGAAGLIKDKVKVLPSAVGIHAVEAYHAGLVRTSIAIVDAGAGVLTGITQKISAVRTTLGGSAFDTGINTVQVLLNGGTNIDATTIVDANIKTNSIAAGRTTAQVLAIVTGSATAPAAGTAYKGGFFPNGLNGLIK